MKSEIIPYSCSIFRFRPTISVTILASRLGLEESKLCEWLTTFGITADDGKIDCRTHSNTVLV